jgi:hypothetical protein
MKKLIKGFLLTTLAAVAMLGLQPSQLRADSANPGNDHKLEGAWDITIWLPLCGGNLCATPYKILRTIAPVGVVDGYGFPGLAQGPTGQTNGTGHGDWRKIGNNTYSATVKYFQLDYTIPPGPFGSVVQYINTVQETIRISADGNSYESDFLTTFALPDGTVVGTNGGKTKATRISVQPLP